MITDKRFLFIQAIREKVTLPESHRNHVDSNEGAAYLLRDYSRKTFSNRTAGFGLDLGYIYDKLLTLYAGFFWLQTLLPVEITVWAALNVGDRYI